MKFLLNFFRKSDYHETLEPVMSPRAEIRHPPQQLGLCLTGVGQTLSDRYVTQSTPRWKLRRQQAAL